MNQTTITMDGCGRVAVPSDTANVWMSEMELVRLFDVIAPTLRAALLSEPCTKAKCCNLTMLKSV